MITPDEPTARPPVALDLDLIRKHSIPGPRTTSYPPATGFVAKQDFADLESAVTEDNRTGAGPLSLYFHLPFCETRCWFCGCTTVITKRRHAAGDYVVDLEADGIVVCTPDAVQVTPLGTPLLRAVALRFDPHVTAGAGQHSRTL